jgi:hypothetical protein
VVRFHETWGGIPRMECLCYCLPSCAFSFVDGFHGLLSTIVEDISSDIN